MKKLEKEFNRVNRGLVISAVMLLITGMFTGALIFIYAAYVLSAVVLVTTCTIQIIKLAKELRDRLYVEAVIRCVLLLVGLLFILTTFSRNLGAIQ